MRCGGCEGEAEECVSWSTVKKLLHGFDAASLTRARLAFDREACGSRKIREGAISRLCQTALVTEGVAGPSGLTDIQAVCAQAIEIRLRRVYPWMDRDDAIQSAHEIVVKHVRPHFHVLDGFNRRARTRSGRPSTVKAYVKAALMRIADKEIAKNDGIYKVQQLGGAKIYHYGPNPWNSKPIEGPRDLDDDAGDEMRAPRPAIGAEHWQAVADLGGRPLHPDVPLSFQGDFIPEEDPSVVATLRIERARAELLQLQRKAIWRVAMAIPQASGSAFGLKARTAEVLRLAAQRDPLVFRSGPDGPLVHRTLVALAGQTNANTWYKRHVVRLLEEACARDPLLPVLLRELCARLDALDALYADHPEDAPSVDVRDWSSRVFHVVKREDVRAFLEPF
jgi:hypothetical protein